MYSNILSDWKPYNANSRQRNTGDCVCRALSLAFGVEYDTMHNMLTSYARKKGYEKYNLVRCFTRYLKEEKGLQSEEVPTSVPKDQLMTVQKFCEANPKGIYVLLCGDGRKRYNSHAVAVVNGNWYDSFDSKDYYISMVFIVDGDFNDNIGDIDVKDMLQQVMTKVQNYIDPYIQHLAEKMPYASVTTEWSTGTWGSEYSSSFRVNVALPTIQDYNPTPRYRMERYKTLFDFKRFVVTMNPRQSIEENAQNQIKRLHTAVREYLYAIRKDIDDDIKFNSVAKNRKYWGSTDILRKLPVSVIPHVTDIADFGEHKRGSWEDYPGERYVIEMEAYEDDPAAEEDPLVVFRSDSLTEIKRQMKQYEDHWIRPKIYDY